MIRSDLDFILAQIKIAEADAEGIDVVQAGLVPNTQIPWGLRRVDGSNNNLTPVVPGMPVEVIIATAKRTALSYFTKPFVDQFNRAFREE